MTFAQARRTRGRFSVQRGQSPDGAWTVSTLEQERIDSVSRDRARPEADFHPSGIREGVVASGESVTSTIASRNPSMLARVPSVSTQAVLVIVEDAPRRDFGLSRSLVREEAMQRGVTGRAFANLGSQDRTPQIVLQEGDARNRRPAHPAFPLAATERKIPAFRVKLSHFLLMTDGCARDMAWKKAQFLLKRWILSA